MTSKRQSQRPTAFLVTVSQRVRPMYSAACIGTQLFVILIKEKSIIQKFLSRKVSSLSSLRLCNASGQLFQECKTNSHGRANVGTIWARGVGPKWVSPQVSCRLSMNQPQSDYLRNSYQPIHIGPTWMNIFGADTSNPYCAYIGPSMKCCLSLEWENAESSKTAGKNYI